MHGKPEHTHRHDFLSKHSHHGVNYNFTFALAVGFNLAFVVVEVVFGIWANSTALLADAGHNAGDVLGLVIAWGASWLAGKKLSAKKHRKYTYGFSKTTVLASLVNAILIIGAGAIIAYEAYHKVLNPEPVAGISVMVVAGIGVVINTATALLFVRGQHDLNLKGAFLHMLADALVSLGVVVAGGIMYVTELVWVDPAVSFVIVAVIVWSTWQLLIDSVNLSLDATPRHINIEEIRTYLVQIPEVQRVHELHVWAMSTTETSLTVHLVVPESAREGFLARLAISLHERFQINHTTVQLENTKEAKNCRGCGIG